MAAARWCPFIRVWVMIRALAPDRHGVFAGLGGAHAAVGGEVGQALVIELEQQPGGDVVRVRGQRVGAEPGLAVEREACLVQAGEQARQVLDQFGVVACLVLAAGPVDGCGQGRDVGCCVRGPGVASAMCPASTGANGSASTIGPLRECASEHGAEQGCAGQPDEGSASHRVLFLLPVLWIEAKQTGDGGPLNAGRAGGAGTEQPSGTQRARNRKRAS